MTDDTQSQDKALAQVRDNSTLAVRSLEDVKRFGNIFVQSGMFKADSRATEAQKLYQAAVKIIAGAEFGVAPFAAMRGINIINGNAEMSSNLMAAKVKAHPKYDYRIKQWDNDGCVIDFYEIVNPGKPIKEQEHLGKSSFDLEDAKRGRLAGGDNYGKFPRNMYFARALSNGVRIHCPDIFTGAPVYVEGEISGEVVEGELVAEPSSDTATDGQAEPATPMITKAQLAKMHATFNELGLTEREARLEMTSDFVGREVESASDLTRAEATALIEHLINGDDEVANDLANFAPGELAELGEPDDLIDKGEPVSKDVVPL